MLLQSKAILLFLIMFIQIAMCFGQDSTQIIYTQEPDTTSVKQRFIDQYENVFMTRIPTRHMLKYGTAFYPVNNVLLKPGRIGFLAAEIGYEFKISPELSIGANASLTNKATDDPLAFRTYSVNIQSRWYFDIKKRIREGKSANNFSGNYVALSFGKSAKYPSESHSMTSIGAEFGVQRRLLNDGRIEFAIGVNYQKYRNDYFLEGVSFNGELISELAITTRTSLGGALGDWKRTDRPPLCEILHCEQELNKQWKVLWPSIYLSSRIKKSTIALGYERKLWKSPLSLNTQVYFDYRNLRLPLPLVSANFKDQFYQLQPSLQLRYYFLQKYAIRRGLGGNNLSGIYVGPEMEYIHFSSKLGPDFKSFRHLGPGFVIGIQKTLFQRIYLDMYGSWSRNIINKEPGIKVGQGSLRIGLGWAI